METETLDKVFLWKEIGHIASCLLIVSDDSAFIFAVTFESIEKALVESSLLLTERGHVVNEEGVIVNPDLSLNACTRVNFSESSEVH